MQFDIQYLSTGKLNTVNDAVVGGDSNSLTGSALKGGQLGAYVHATERLANQLSDTDTGTLHEGRYRYVQTKAGSTAAPARGLIAFYATAADRSAFIVTPDCPTGDGCIAGVYIGAPSKGQYCFIQEAGLASVKFTDTITKATPAAQDMVFVKTADNVAQVEEDATAVTCGILKRELGTASETPVADEIKLVSLWDRFRTV